MAKLTQREMDLVACASFIKWMNDAFNTSSTNKKLRGDVRKFSAAYQRVVASYEEEIECLKSALNAANDTQTTSTPVPVDSAAAPSSDIEMTW